jgi:hypothetical protein
MYSDIKPITFFTLLLMLYLFYCANRKGQSPHNSSHEFSLLNPYAPQAPSALRKLFCVWQGWRPGRQPCHTHVLHAPRSGAHMAMSSEDLSA